MPDNVNAVGGISKDVKVKANRIKNSAFNLCTREDIEKFKKENFVEFMQWIGKLIPKDLNMDAEVQAKILNVIFPEKNESKPE